MPTAHGLRQMLDFIGESERWYLQASEKGAAEKSNLPLFLGAHHRCRYQGMYFSKVSRKVLVLIGLESASQRILDSLKKGNTISQFERAFQYLSSNQVPFCAGFIYGLPGQTEKDLMDNIEFYNRYEFFDSAVQQILPLPGAALYDELLDKGKLPIQDLRYWEMVKEFSKPIPALNFTDIPDEKYCEIFHDHSVYIYEAGKRNRKKLVEKYNLKKYLGK